MAAGPSAAEPFRSSDPGSTRPLAVGSPHPRAPTFVGRREELTQLWSALRNGVAGSGSTWVITGPAGIGKTRLLRRAAELAAPLGYDLRWGYGIEGTVTPMFPFLQVLRVGDPDSPAGRRGAYPGSGASTRGENPVRELRGRRVGARRLAPAGPSAIGVRPPTVRTSGNVDYLLLEIARELEQLAEERPLLVLLDNLESSDPETIRCLHLLSKVAPRSRMVVLAAARADGDVSAGDAPLGALLGNRGPVGATLERLSLPGLSPEERLQLVRDILERNGRSPDASEVLDMVQSCGGNPYFLVEMAGAWAERSSLPGVPLPRPAHRAASPLSEEISPALPQALEGIVQGRLQLLSEGQRELAGVAAHLGADFTAPMLAAILGRPTAEVSDQLSRWGEDGWPVVPVPGSRGRYAFSHALLRSFVRRSPEFSPAPSSLRNALAWVRAQGPDDPLTEARLRSELGDGPGASDCLGRALDLLVRQGAFARLPKLLRWGRMELDPGPAGLARGAALAIRAAEQLRDYWEFPMLKQILSDLPGESMPPSTRWIAHCWLAESMVSAQPREAARRLRELERELSIEPSLPAEQLRPRLEYLRALVVWYTKSPALAHVFVAHVADELDAEQFPTEKARLLLLDSMGLSNQRRWPEARRALQASYRFVRRVPRASATYRDKIRHGDAHIAFRSGRVAAAIACGRRRVTEALREGYPGFAVHALMQLSSFAYSTRDTASARRYLAQLEELAQRLDNTRALAVARLILGWCLVCEQDWPRARGALRSVTALEDIGEWQVTQWASLVGLALVQAETGDPEGALRSLPPIPAVATATGSWVVEFHSARARILELSGRPGAAHRALLTGVRMAERGQVPITDRIEAYGQLERWELQHGTPVGEQRWKRRIRSLPPSWRGVASRRWQLIGGTLPEGNSPPTERRVTIEPFAGGAEHLRARLLFLLAARTRAPRASPASGPTPGVTEAEIAAVLATPRERFSRALQRLRLAGLVERQVTRPAGAKRRLFVYGLTSRGMDAADGLPSPGSDVR